MDVGELMGDCLLIVVEFSWWIQVKVLFLSMCDTIAGTRATRLCIQIGAEIGEFFANVTPIHFQDWRTFTLVTHLHALQLKRYVESYVGLDLETRDRLPVDRILQYSSTVDPPTPKTRRETSRQTKLNTVLLFIFSLSGRNATNNS
jgi:hypothetical protein